MTEYSYNGWSASKTLAIRPLVVQGESFSPGVRDDDDVYTVFKWLAEQLHERVEPIVKSDWHQADDWGYSYRENRNDPNSLSCHASGTAIDYNATRHPNGVSTRSTFTSAQVQEIHDILDELDGVIRWGGDYTGTPDAMHFEIIKPKERVAAVARLLREEEDDMPYTEDQLINIVRRAIKTELDPLKAAQKKRYAAEQARDERLREVLKQRYNATQTDLDAIFAEVSDE